MSWYSLEMHHGETKRFGSDGRLEKIVDVHGNETIFLYEDADGDGFARELDKIIDPFGREFNYAYDYVNDLLLSITDFQGRQFSFDYDAQGRLETVTATDPDPSDGDPAPKVILGYDSSSSLLTSITDPEGKVTTVAYGSDLRIDSITHPDTGSGAVTEFYDSIQTQGLEELVLLSSVIGTVTKSDGVAELVHEYRADGFGYITEYTDPLTHTTKYERDHNGQVTKVTNALSETVTYEYDHHGRKTAAHYDDGTDEIWTYDENNHLIHDPLSYKDRLDHTWNYTYYSNGDLWTETNPEGSITTYIYYANGLLESVIEPDPDDGTPTGPATHYEYDTRGNLSKITFADNSSRTYAYDFNGYLISETDELLRTTYYDYDDLGRRIEIKLPDPDGIGTLYNSPIYRYAYDEMGRLISETDPRGHETKYDYDARGQLIRITFPDPDVPNAAHGVTTIQYEYDDDGNLISETDQRGNVTHYKYDANGNLQKVTQPYLEGTDPANAPKTTFTYDALNRLASETNDLDVVTTYTYRSFAATEECHRVGCSARMSFRVRHLAC